MLWTLPFEIGFYLLLPLLAWGQRRVHPAPFIFVSLAVVGIWWPPFFFFFASGVAAAMLVGWRHRRADAVPQIATDVSMAMLIATAHRSSLVLQAALLVPVMAAAVRETWLCRWLRLRPLRFVGEIRYSVYVLHYPLLWIGFLAMGGPAPLATAGIAARWAMLAACGTAVLAIATLCCI